MKKKINVGLVKILVIMLLFAAFLPSINAINLNKETISTLDDTSWEWAESGGGYSLDYGNEVVCDGNGNSYIIGKYFDEATFGTFTLGSFGPIKSWEIFVAKLDKDGNWLWAVGAGGTLMDKGNGIALDNDGNIYITGIFYDTAYFGNITMAAYGYSDVYIAKLDNDGNWLWAIQAGGHAGEEAYGIAVDDTGNIYVTGHFMNLATFGPFPLNSQGSADVFVVKLDTDGNWIWAQRGGGISPDFVCDIALDNNGNIYLTGDFEGSATFGADTITSLGNVDVFIAKLDNDGNWLWARCGGSYSIERGYSISVDNDCNAYISGVFLVSITFGNTTLISEGEWDVYVLKMDTDGNWQWVVRGGSSGSDGNRDIVTYGNGDSLIAGCFSGTATYGASTITSLDVRDVFVAKIDTNGNWLWAISGGGYYWDEGYAITADEHKNVYVTGYFDGSANFGNSTLITEGDYDVFIAKLSDGFENLPPAVPSIDGTTNGAAGQEYSYSFSTTDIEGDDFYLYIDWDDGTYEEWIGPFSSGEVVTIDHTWDEKDTYEIRAKAKDIYESESDWGTLEVVMPINQQLINYPLLERFIERFPNAFPIIQIILSLID